jgi:hypothetical protein
MKNLIKGYGREKRLGYTVLRNKMPGLILVRGTTSRTASAETETALSKGYERWLSLPG